MVPVPLLGMARLPVTKWMCGDCDIRSPEQGATGGTIRQVEMMRCTTMVSPLWSPLSPEMQDEGRGVYQSALLFGLQNHRDAG
jgi:hypothetical protein